MQTVEEASDLVVCVGSGTRADDARFAIGVARGRLFSLIVAGSAMVGVDAFESPETLRSIVNETRVLLEDATGHSLARAFPLERW